MAQDIVFDIGGMHFRSGLVDENGRVSSQVAFDSPGDPDDMVEHIQRVVDSFSVSAQNPAVGIAIGGLDEGRPGDGRSHQYGGLPAAPAFGFEAARSGAERCPCRRTR